MTQHSTLSEERWSRFSAEQQLLMIANEMHRISRLTEASDLGSRLLAYERVLKLADLTTATTAKKSLKRELDLWKGLVRGARTQTTFDSRDHSQALKALLLMNPTAAKQIPYVVREQARERR